jgi:hypothetical protein
MAYQGMIPVGSLIIGYVSHTSELNTLPIQGIISILSVIVYVYYKKHKASEELETCPVTYKNSKF